MSGWQRLWVVACILLACYAVIENFSDIQHEWTRDKAYAQFLSVRLFGIWLGLSVGLYIAGLTIRWVYRGFRPKKA